MQRRIRDVLQMPDGALLVITDDKNGELLRLTPASSSGAPDPNALSRGRSLGAARGRCDAPPVDILDEPRHARHEWRPKSCRARWI